MEKIIEQLLEGIYDLKYYIDYQNPPLMHHDGEKVSDKACYQQAAMILARKDDFIKDPLNEFPKVMDEIWLELDARCGSNI